MTLETCKVRYDLAKERGDEEEMEYWEARARRKASRHAKYKDVDVDELLGLKDGKKSKRRA